MTGETKHVYAINTKEPSSKDTDKGIANEQFGKKDEVEIPTSCVPQNSESVFIGGDKTPQLNGREKEPHSQREAVIRPQQAGKIDFKSLHNRTKFPCDATWTNNKGSPLSPTGKSRGKDKTKRSGKGDRTQHQLYRLSINNSRSNPTIGIAYPQQKVTPPKKFDITRGPVSGSYRFHVPSLPEREAELQQEDLSFSQCFPESSPSLTSTSYTSQSTSASRTHLGLKLQSQPGNPHETSSNAQLHYLEFQPSGSSWHSPEKNFPGTSSYGVPSQKVCQFPEGNKSDPHCFGSMSFQYPFQSIQETTGNSFCNNGNNQDFVDVSLTGKQVSHTAFPFQSSSREATEDSQSNVSYNNVLPDSRTYSLPSQQATFLHAHQGAQHLQTPPCYTVRNEHSTEHNGAISSSGAITSSGAIDQSQSTFQENQSVFNSSEFSLHGNGVPALVNNRQQPSKDFTSNQRLLTPGNILRRNIPQSSLNQMHFPSKVYNSVNTGTVPFDNSISRIPQTWDAENKTFPPLDQNTGSYPNSSGNPLPFQSNADNRQALKNARMPWQQINLTSGMPNQNGIELSRQIGNQKLPHPLGTSEWQTNNLLQKIPPGYHTKKHLIVDGISTQRTDAGRQNYGSSNGILFDNGTDANSQLCDSRNKSILYGMSQPIKQARNNPNQPVSLPTANLIVGSPCESPLPSPVTNPVSGSTCSSLSPMSNSPVNPSSDENQMPVTLATSPYFHQQCHSENKRFNTVDNLSSSSIMYHTPEPIKNFNYLTDASKEDQLFKNLQENQYQKQVNEPIKGCLESFENEPPPPPPYSSHHLLASSLSSANLDQLDVLLTCKQCDQNYSNLSSFLEHRQYCSLNSTLQNEMKDALRGPEIRKQAVGSLKTSNTISGLSLNKGHIEFQPHMTGFQKAVDYFLDSDSKGEGKEDSMKVNIFHSLTSNSMPLPACDILEMDDAKLDSLITEALNGLEWKVDNAEIDSSFIDVFVDDDLSSIKASNCGQPLKAKESVEIKKRVNGVEEKLSLHKQMASDIPGETYGTDPSYNERNSIMKPTEQKNMVAITTHPFSFEKEKIDKKIRSKNLEDREFHKKGETEEAMNSESKTSVNINKNDLEFIDDKNAKSNNAQKGSTIKTASPDFFSTENHKPRRQCMKDVKKNKAHNGSWSKELIHKIVQQKNKLHKLHVKNNKNLQFSLVTERIFPSTKSHPFGEYDYISDSEEDVDSASLLNKNLPNGRLKCNFNRDHQVRGGKTKAKEALWKLGEATRFPQKNRDFTNSKKENSNRIRRRSSQSSTSSDLSTGVSSETGSSPKSTERTDSEHEQEIVLRHKLLSVPTQNIAAERNLIKPLYKESPTKAPTNQTDFFKGTKRFGSAKFLLSGSKPNGTTNFCGKESLDQMTENKNANDDKGIKSTELNICQESSDKDDRVSTYQKPNVATNLSQDYPTDLILDADKVSQQFPTFHKDAIDYQDNQLNSSPCAVDNLNDEANARYADVNVEYLKEELCNEQKDFAITVGCYREDSLENMLPEKRQDLYSSESQQFPEHKELSNLFSNDLFTKPQSISPPEIEQLYINQGNNTSISNTFEHKCTDITTYSANIDENKVSSTLSFDSSSIFAMPDFESPMYSNCPTTKDNYISFTSSNDQQTKPIDFGQQYPQFLQDKCWDMIEEAPSMLSNSIAPFHGIENQNSEKFAEGIPAPTGQIALTLPETIADYNDAFINNISEDELEIKRLVTELESELQTSKLHEASSQVCSKKQDITDLSESSVSFSDMVVKSIENNTKDLYFKDNLNSLNNIIHTVVEGNADQKLQDHQPLVNVDGSCDDNKSPWSHTDPFGSFTSNIQCEKDTSTLDSFNHTESNTKYQTALNEVCFSDEIDSLSSSNKSPSIMHHTCLHSLTNQLESQTFSEDKQVKDHPITAEPSPLKTEEQEDTNEKDDCGNSFLKKKHLEDTFDDPPELEPFQNTSELHSDIELQENCIPGLNITATPIYIENVSEESQCSSVFKSETLKSTTLDHSENNQTFNKKEASAESTLCGNKQSNEKSNKMDLVLLDMPVLEKEESATPEKLAIVDNPLQQLQLFVARTAKNNEEDMLMPCFPLLLPSSVSSGPQPEVEDDSSYNSESKLSVSKEMSQIDIAMTELNANTHFLETNKDSVIAEKLHSLETKDTSPAMQHETLSNEMQNEAKPSTGLEHDHSALAVINADDLTNDHINLLSQSNSTENLLLEQKTDDQITTQLHMDGTVKNGNSSYFSHLFESEDFTISSPNTTNGKAIEIGLADKASEGCLLPCDLNMEVTRQCKDTVTQDTQGQHTEAIDSPSVDHQQKDLNSLQDADLFLTKDEINKETRSLEEKSKVCLFIDGSSAQSAFHDNQEKAVHESNMAYQMELQELDSSATQTQLSFDLFPHLPLNESIQKQALLCTTTDYGSRATKEDTTFNSAQNFQVENETSLNHEEKHSVGGSNGLVYLCDDGYVTSSMEIDQNQNAKCRVSVSSNNEENISPYFCSELVCSDYKEQPTTSVSDILLECQSLPTSDGYPIYTAAETHTYADLQAELFTQNVKTITDSSLCCQQETHLNCNWSDRKQNTSINNQFSSETQTTSLVCDFMGISESQFPNLSHHQESEKTAGRQVQTSKNAAVIENDGTTGDSIAKCTSDMDSVINGVLRILDCDKSKEILESIGIPSRSSPTKEKKSVGLSLTCDICLVSFKSKPGLTRHKAVKHNTKKDGTSILNNDTSRSENPQNLKYERVSPVSEKGVDEATPPKTAKVLSNQSFPSESGFQNQTSDLLNEEHNLHSQYLISDENHGALTAKCKGEKRGKGHCNEQAGSEVISKKKPNGKFTKRKVKLLSNNCTASQVPSDEILNILKTNILKAIGESNSFATSEEKLAIKDPDKLQQECKEDSSVRESHSKQKTATGDEMLVSKSIYTETNGDCSNGEHEWPTHFKEDAENIATNIGEKEQYITSTEQKAPLNESEDKQSRGHFNTTMGIPSHDETFSLDTNTSANVQEICLNEHFSAVEPLHGANDPRVSKMSKDNQSDHHNLFDDDNTFSQLFPRDDNFIRRKCTRVYGKKTRRQTPPLEVDFKPIDFVDASHSSQIRNYSSSYGKLSNESNSSSCITANKDISRLHAEFDHVSPIKEVIEVNESRMLSFVCQNQPEENVHDPTLIIENQEQNGRDDSFDDNLYKSPAEPGELFGQKCGAISSVHDSDVEEKYDCKMDDESNLPEFPTIDMKMLSAKFDMSELSFFSACGDDSDHSEVDTQDIPQKAERHKRTAKYRTNDRRQARNRNVNLKNKDKQYKCKVCFQWFLTLGELDFHKLTHNPSPPPTCYMCVQRKFSSREQLRDHLKDKHAKNKAGLWICGMCLKEISDVWMYNEHLREHATQFARKGQAQKSVMGIPGCFTEDSMVRTFLSTFIYRTPNKAPKTSEAEEKNSPCKKQDHKEQKVEDMVTEKEPESTIHIAPNAPVNVKLSVSQPLENTLKSDLNHKNPAIHPHCKDPSRDCHHCGKQFPKPFKLQRHLVVHSLQKIYLCHICPKSYQEVQELRSHLNNEHQLTEEPEIKHTTLYACELCADVMHVIKKSFICSTCNYTFSKKEQYDRHMEKHLIGGSMTFKFRGVMRPNISGKEVKENIREHFTNDSMPQSKRQKTFHGTDHPPDIRCKKVEDIMENERTVEIKIEDMAVDIPELQRETTEVEITPYRVASSPSGHGSNEMKRDADKNGHIEINEKINIINIENISPSTETEKEEMPITQDAEDLKLMEPPTLYPINPEYVNGAEKRFLYSEEEDEEIAEVPEMGSPQGIAEDMLCQLLPKKSEELFELNNELPPVKDSSRELYYPKNEHPDKESALKSLRLDGADICPVLQKENTAAPDINVQKDSKGLKKSRSVNQLNSRLTSNGHVVSSETMMRPSTQKIKATFETCVLGRESNACTFKDTTGSHQKLSKKELTTCVIKQTNSDPIKPVEKISAILPPKLHTKKRKEHKIAGHKGSTASQENMTGEGKKKKTKLLGTGKTESSGSFKKTDWISNLPAFSETKDEALCSRQCPKPHTGGTSGHLKKIVLDMQNQKKPNSWTSNGEYKSKKAPLAKNLQPFTSKSSALSLNSPSHKRRQGNPTKSTEPTNYRTAESQNNLLSQLFGQKLTSFKIPLRRDITE